MLARANLDVGINRGKVVARCCVVILCRLCSASSGLCAFLTSGSDSEYGGKSSLYDLCFGRNFFRKPPRDGRPLMMIVQKLKMIKRKSR